MLKNKTGYKKQSQEKYEDEYNQRLIKNLKYRAKQLGMIMVPIEVT